MRFSSVGNGTETRVVTVVPLNFTVIYIFRLDINYNTYMYTTNYYYLLPLINNSNLCRDYSFSSDWTTQTT